MLVFTVCLTSPARPSATTRKRKGVKGSPCLSPLEGLNSSVGDENQKDVINRRNGQGPKHLKFFLLVFAKDEAQAQSPSPRRPKPKKPKSKPLGARPNIK